MEKIKQPKLQIFFDGQCIVCSTEILHYKKLDSDNILEIIDITHPDFDAQKFGLTREAVNRFMHIRSPDGSIHTGVDAFAQIWKALPRYRLAYRITQIPGVKPALKPFYYIFALGIRPLLPKRKT